MRFRSLSSLCLAVIFTASASASEQKADQDFFSLLEEKGFSQKVINQLKPSGPSGASKRVAESSSKNNASIDSVKLPTSQRNPISKVKPDLNYIERPQPRIIGGTPVSPGERGYQVSLQHANQHACGGALIDREWVLTAAHCLSGTAALSVVVATQDLADPDAMRLMVDAVYVHPDYDRDTSNNDIALLHLAEPAAEHLPLLKLADEKIMAEFGISGSMATVSGWGVTDPVLGEIVDLLQQVDVPLVNSDECRASYGESHPGITDSTVCAGFPTESDGPCVGDSGGPLTVSVHGEDYSTGVVSWGSNCDAGFPSVYTRVASFTEWIHEIIQSGPYVVNPVSETEMDSISLNEGETRYFKFTPTALNLLNFEIVVFSDSDDVEFTLYKGAFPLEANTICSASVQSEAGRCGTRLASQGVYTLGLQAKSSAAEVKVEVSYIDLVLGDGTVIDNISTQAGHYLELHLPIEQAVSALSISLTGGNGNTLLIGEAYDANDDWYANCISIETGSDEVCTLENVVPGRVNVILFSPFTDVDDLTLSISYDEPEQSFPPLAICQHSVIQQLGDYFIASISIINMSEQYLNDWYVEWDYSFDTSIAMMLNGIISGVEPYHAVSAEQGRAIAPGGLTNLYLLVNSPNGLAENPVVDGNYCF